MRDGLRDKIYARALRLLARRPYSEVELRAKLKAYGPADQIEDVIAELKGQRLINDLDFSYNFASYRVRVKLFGRARAAGDLRRRQVPSRIIEQALERVFADIDEEELIDLAIAKWEKRRGKPKDLKELKRMLNFLERQGFSYDLIRSKLEPSFARFAKSRY